MIKQPDILLYILHETMIPGNVLIETGSARPFNMANLRPLVVQNAQKLFVYFKLIKVN